MDVLERVQNLWEFVYPELAYKSGISQAAGRFFVRTDDALEEVHKRCAEIEASLEKIADEDLRITARNLARACRRRVSHLLPDKVIAAAAWGLYTIILKRDSDKPFVVPYLQEVASALRIDANHWEDVKIRIETKRHLYESIVFLQAALQEASRSNTNILPLAELISSLLTPYKDFYKEDGIETKDVSDLLSLFKQDAGPPEPLQEYGGLLEDLYDFSWRPDQMRALALEWLAEELPRINHLVIRQAGRYGCGADFEAVYSEMCRSNDIKQDEVIAVATHVTNGLNAYTAENWLRLTPEDRVEIIATPDYWKELSTEGSVESFDQLTGLPRNVCFLTPSKNENYLTMLNVLVHEYAHAFHNSLTFRLGTHDLLKIESPLRAPSTEGIAFHREWELYEEARDLLARSHLRSDEEQLLALFGSSNTEQVERLEEFELETRMWRVARFLRVLCDVEVHLGSRTYSGFLEWASERTGFLKNRIHDYCFSFLRQPGYASCYAVPGMHLAELQATAQTKGYSRKAFNTEASSMGFYSWTRFERRLRNSFHLEG